MLTINLNYDRKFDILYARMSNYAPSYGDEENGIVTYYSIESDAITGMAIYNAKQRIQDNEIAAELLPVPIDLNSSSVQALLHKPENGFRCSLQLA